MMLCKLKGLRLNLKFYFLITAAAFSLRLPLQASQAVEALEFEQKAQASQPIISPEEQNRLNSELAKSIDCYSYSGDRRDALELLDQGADINFQSDKGTLLHAAAMRGDDVAMHDFINRGADINAPGRDGVTPLMEAAGNRKPKMVKNLLLQRSVCANLRDNDGNTALMYAARYHSPGSVTWLLKACANPLLKNNKGETALMIAQMHPKKSFEFAKRDSLAIASLQNAEKDWKKVISAQRMNLPEKIFESENLFGKQGKGGTTRALGKEVSEWLGVSKVPTIKVPHSTISQKEWLRLQVLYDLAHKNQLTPGIEMKEFKQLVETIDREVKAKRAFATPKQWKLLNAAMVTEAELSLRMHA